MWSVPAVAPGFFPLDDESGLLPGNLTPSLAESVVLLGTAVPSFARAATLLEHFTKVQLSGPTMRRRTEAAGAAYVAVQRAAVQRLSPQATRRGVQRERPEGPAGPAVLPVSVDGAMAPLLHGQWAEVKTLAVGRVEQRTGPTGEPVVRTTELSYFSRMADHETFRRLAWAERHRRGMVRAERVAGVADGSGWCQGFLDYHRPDAVRVLDFPHGMEHMAAAGQAVGGTGTVRLADWLDQQAHEWKTGDPVQVLAGLVRLPVDRARDPPQAAAVQAATLDYLAKRWDQVQYADFVAQGLPIGRGTVESANKLVVEVRLKGSGMHWQRGHVDPMVALRTAVCSVRWEEAWPAIEQELRRQAQERAAGRREQRRVMRLAPPLETASAHPTRVAAAMVPPVGSGPGAAPATEGVVLSPAPAASAPKVVNGKPTADHPWRRPFVVSRRAS